MQRTLRQRFVQWVMEAGDDPTDSADHRLRKNIFKLGFSAGVPALMLFSLPYLLFGDVLGAISYYLYCIPSAVAFFLMAQKRISFHSFCAVAFSFALVTHTFISLHEGGFVESAGWLLWGLLNPVVTALLVYGMRAAVFWFIVYAANFVANVFLYQFIHAEPILPSWLVSGLFAANMLMLSAFTLVILAYFFFQRDLAYSLLHEEQSRAENLLLNILPSEIAAVLKRENRTIAEHYDGASILFADVVNFTPLSASMSPVELVELLNEVFTYFDSLVEKYGLEKIKTIGDCYMAASGVPRPNPDHAQVLVRAAIEMRDHVAANEFKGHTLRFRMGINSGSVVAGVIGRKKFIYDLWGDAVNTASRMESHGQGNTIQITRATYDLIKDDFECVPRGTINVKGKGEMEVWHVIGRVHNLAS